MVGVSLRNLRIGVFELFGSPERDALSRYPYGYHGDAVSTSYPSGGMGFRERSSRGIYRNL